MQPDIDYRCISLSCTFAIAIYTPNKFSIQSHHLDRVSGCTYTVTQKCSRMVQEAEN